MAPGGPGLGGKKLPSCPGLFQSGSISQVRSCGHREAAPRDRESTLAEEEEVMHLSTGQPMAPTTEGNFPVGISKRGPNCFFIKARVKVPSADPRLKPDDRRMQTVFYGTKAQADDK